MSDITNIINNFEIDISNINNKTSKYINSVLLDYSFCNILQNNTQLLSYQNISLFDMSCYIFLNNNIDKIIDQSLNTSFSNSVITIPQHIFYIKNQIKPTINLLGDNPIILNIGETYIEPGYNATNWLNDDIALEINNNITISGIIDISKTGIYTLTYSVFDQLHNTDNQIFRTIYVIDNKPYIELIGSNYITIEVYNEFNDPGYTLIDNGVSNIYVDISSSVNINTLGEYKITYQIYDNNGSKIGYALIRYVYVVDKTAPVLIILNGGETYIHERFNEFNDPGYIVSDNYDTNVDVVVSGVVDISQVGQYTLTYIATDNAGNTSQAKRLVVVQDTIAPLITISGDSTFFVEQFSTFIDPGYVIIGSDLSVNVVVTGAVDTSQLGEYTLTYIASDDIGNTSQDTRTVIVQDTIAPLITISGDSTFIVERFTTFIDPGYDISGNDVSVNVVVTGVVDISQVGEYTLTYIASDNFGNASQDTRTVIVQDTTAPLITISGDSTFIVERFTTFIDPGYVTTGSDLSVNVVVTGVVDISQVGQYTLTYIASDDIGNASQVTRTVIVQDTIASVITISGDSTFIVERFTTFIDPGYIITGSDISVNVVVTGVVDTSQVGEYTLTYIASDDVGNTSQVTRTVIVQDTIAPLITISGDNPFIVERFTTFNDPGYITTGSDVSVNVVVTGVVDTSQVGEYTLTYIASDDVGNTSQVTRTVIVQDTIAPLITISGDSTFIVERFTTFNDPGYITTGSDVSVNVVVTGVVDISQVGEYILTYIASDDVGNTSQVTRTVIVQDTIAPLITISGDSTFIVERFTTFNDPGYITTGSDVSVNVVVTGVVDTSQVGEYILTYIASDDVGNTSQVTRTVIVQDTISPLITISGDSTFIVERFTTFNDPGYMTTGSDVSVNVVVTGVVDISEVGEYTLTYIASDDVGNTSQVTRTVIVQDTISPLITISGDSTFIVERFTTFNDPGYITTGSDVSVNVVVTGVVDTSQVGQYTLTYIASDDVGNTSQVTRTVIVQDTIAPLITISGDSTFIVERFTTFNDPGYITTGSDVSVNVVVTGVVDISQVGEYILTYIASDDVGNTSQVTRTVIVQDTIAPLITISGDSTFIVERFTTFNDPGYITTGSDVSVNVVVTGVVDISQVGEYTLTYIASDDVGNTSQVTRTVIVQDTIAPLITISGDSTFIVERFTTFNDPGYITTGSDVSVNVVVTGVVDISQVGEYTLTYIASDDVGNTSQVTRTVIVQDTIAPLITISGDSTFIVERFTTFNDPGYITTGSDVSVNVVITGVVDISQVGEYTLTYIASDDVGNTSQVTRTVIVQDTIAPLITISGDSTFIVERFTTFNDPGYITTGSDVSVNVVITGVVTSGVVEYTYYNIT